MLFERLFGRFFVKLERNNIIRLQCARELTHHHHGISAERARGCRRVFIADNFAAAGFADIAPQTVSFSALPLTAGGGFPVHFVRLLILKLAVIGF